eukprot:scaffold920_cov135-Isochrysis_galbana.AAC.3
MASARPSAGRRKASRVTRPSWDPPSAKSPHTATTSSRTCETCAMSVPYVLIRPLEPAKPLRRNVRDRQATASRTFRLAFEVSAGESEQPAPRGDETLECDHTRGGAVSAAAAWLGRNPPRPVLLNRSFEPHRLERKLSEQRLDDLRFCERARARQVNTSEPRLRVRL